VKIPPSVFFEDYCKHYGLTFILPNGAELAYDNHFQREWQTLKCPGYKIIEKLHNNSTQSSFVACRSNFNLEYLSVIERLQNIIDKLETEEALLVAAHRVSRNEVHSSAIGCDHTDCGWYYIETRPTAPQAGIITLTSIDTLLGLWDGLLLTKK
jgi:hypothetical protein